MSKPARKRRKLPYIFAELPPCKCGCVDFEIDGGTHTDRDGSKCQYATCLYCRIASKIIWGIPEGAFRLADNSESERE